MSNTLLPARARSAVLVLSVLLGVGAGAASAAPGDIDLSFGDNGVLSLQGPTNIPNFLGHDAANALSALPDGRALVAGSFDMGRDLGYANMAVVRLTAAGLEDPTFGPDGNGRTQAQLPGDQDSADAILVQPDGRIVVAGALEASANTDFGIARFLADGTPDTSFGESDGQGARRGHARVNVGTSAGANDFAVAVARQSIGANAGKLVVAGSGLGAEGDVCCYRRVGLARFNADGTLDTTFGGSNTGFHIASHPGTPGLAEYPTAIATRRDGTLPQDRITVVGLTNQRGNPSQATVRRFMPDGTPDKSFAVDGLLVIENTLTGGVYTGLKSIDAALYQDDGKLLLVGRAGDMGFTFMRLNADGTRDTTFGSNGRVSVRFPGSDGDEPAALAIQNNGKIVAAGFTSTPQTTDFAVVRLLKDGSLDTRFGTGGRVSHSLVPGSDAATSVAILSDGSILVAGFATRPGIGANQTQTDMAFLRLLGDPSLFSDGFED